MSEAANPFEPPRAEWEKGARPAFAGDFVDAGQGARFVNFILDNMFRSALAYGAALVLRDYAWITVLITVGYYVAFEAIFARTPAKWITKTRVIDQDGGTPTFTQVLGRSLARFVPFEPFSFLFNVRGWHDRWPGTRVVKHGVRLSDI
jgi:uncharacterized RDD family membrane protein YckC